MKFKLIMGQFFFNIHIWIFFSLSLAPSSFFGIQLLWFGLPLVLSFLFPPTSRTFLSPFFLSLVLAGSLVYFLQHSCSSFHALTSTQIFLLCFSSHCTPFYIFSHLSHSLTPNLVTLLHPLILLFCDICWLVSGGL